MILMLYCTVRCQWLLKKICTTLDPSYKSTQTKANQV